MPIYNLNNRVYDIPDDVVKEFEKDNPTATMAYQDGEDIYDIQVNQKEEFLKQFPNAKLYVEQQSSMSGQKQEEDPFEANMKKFQEGKPIDRVSTQSMLDSNKGETGIPESELQRLRDIHNNAQKQIDEASFFDRFFDEETRAAVATRNKSEEALEIYEEANREKGNWFDRNVVGALKGFADKFGDLSTWDFGASGLASAKTLNDISAKLENGEQLSSAEQNMLDAYGLATAVQSAYQDKVGMAYNVGGSLPESIAFGGSLLINPAGGVGKKLAETAAKAAVKKYGTTLASKLAKGAARVGGDVLEMGVATAIPGAGRVAEDYYNRLNGQSTFDIDENGIIRYGGQVEQEEADDAIWKAMGSQFIENYTEAMGNYFAPMGKMISNLTSKGLKAAHLGKFADVIGDISSSQFSKGLQRFKQATKFDGLVGEYLEEVAGNVMNAATVGDMNFNSPEDPRSVFNPETNIETFLSCALLSGTMYAVEAPVSIYNKNVAKKNLNNADNAAKKLWGDRWEDMRSQMDEADPQLLAQLLTGVQNATDLSEEQKQAAKDYGMRLMQYQGYNSRRLQNEAESTSDANEINNAYDEGADLQTPYDKHSAKRAADMAEAALGLNSENADEQQFAQMVIAGANNPVATVNAMAEQGYSEEEIAKAKNYYAAMNRMNGMTDALLDNVNSQIESANAEVDANTNKDTGAVTQVVLRNGEIGYVVERTVVRDEKGNVDVNNSDDVVYVRLQNGQVKQMNPNKDLASVSWIESPETLKENNNTILRQSLIDKGIQEIDWNPATPNPKVGDSFEMDGVPVTIVSHDGKGGMFVVSTEEYQAAVGSEKKMQELVAKAQLSQPIPASEYKNWASAQLDAQEEAVAAQEAVAEEVAAEAQTAEEAQAVEETAPVEEKRPMTEDEAAEFIFKMERNAVEAPEIELTPENWIAEFGENGLVETPIGQVKFGQGQYLKLQQQGRNGKLGMIRPTLTNPDIIIEDTSKAKEGDIAERGSSYVFIKSFKGKDGKRVYYFTSITIKKDGAEVVVSNQEKRLKQIQDLMMRGKMLWNRFESDSDSSGENQAFSSATTENPNSGQPGSTAQSVVQSVSDAQIEESVPLNDSNKPTSTDNQPALLGINSSELSINKDNKQNVQSQENQGDFVAMGKENAFKVLGEKYGEKMPHKVEVTAKAFAKDLEKAQSKLDKAIEDYDNAAIGREDKAENALNVAQKEFDKIKREADFWAFLDTEIKAAQVMPGEEAAEEILSLEEPLNGEEFAALNLANGNIKLLRSSFIKETGFGNKEANKYIGLFASAEKGGVSIERAGELVMQYDREEGTNFYDQSDPNAGRNAIIEVLSKAQTKKELADLIKNNRIEQAKKEQEAEFAAYEAWVVDNFHMSVDEYQAYEEVIARYLAERALTEADYQEFMSTFVDETFNKIEDEQQGIIGESERSSEVLQGTQPVSSEGTGRIAEESTEADGGIVGENGTVPESASGSEVVETNKPYTVEPATYKTKKGKVLDMFLVKFPGEIRKDVQKSAKSFAKELKGWWSREEDGFLMRSQEDAEKLAEYVIEDQSQESVSMEAMKEVSDGNISFSEPQEPAKENEPVWQYIVHVDKESGHTTLRREDVSSVIPIGDARFTIQATSPQEMLDILRNPLNGLQQALDAVGITLENRVKTIEMDKRKKSENLPKEGELYKNNMAGGNAVAKIRGVGKDGYLVGFASDEEDANANFFMGESIVPSAEMGKWLADGVLTKIESEKKEEKPKSKWVDDEDVERFEELRKRLKVKLGGQLNIGLDPEAYTIGVQMTYLMLKHGARKFAEYAANMIEALGDYVRPYLKSYYNGARDLPEMAQYAEDMTPYEEVSAFDVANFDKPSVDVLASAETTAKEEEVEKQVEVAKKRIKKHAKTSKKTKENVSLLGELFNQNQEENETRTEEQRRNGSSKGNSDSNEHLGREAREEGIGTSVRGETGSMSGHNVSDKNGSGRVHGISRKPSVKNNSRNFSFGEGYIEVPSGDVAKLKANIEAIRTLKEIEASGQPATDAQKAVLAKYVGWGG